MKIADWLHSSTLFLTRHDIPTARLDCLVLLADALEEDKAYVLARPELELTDVQVAQLKKQLIQRSQHIPLAYIRGRTEFYGREFSINKHVLEPRPESETMIEQALTLLSSLPGANVIDIGTGSGALAITVKLEAPRANVHAVDIDPNCLDVAKQNASLHRADISFCQGDLFAPFSAKILANTVVLANLPYVPETHTINQAAANEPKLAIFGGTDGLDLYRTMFAQFQKAESLPAAVLTESLPFQHQSLERIAADNGYRLENTSDFIQVFTPSSQKVQFQA